MVVTFVLTMVIPLQYAVVVGVGLSVVLYVVRQSNQVTVTERRFDGDDGTTFMDVVRRDERVGRALRRAYVDTEDWIRSTEHPLEEQ